LVTVLRHYDTVGRYGGEEFLVVLPGCGQSAAVALAERLRDCMQAEPIADGGLEMRVTLSVGVCVWDTRMSSQELLRSADEALYEAKRAGRNCVRSAACAAR